MDRIRSHKQFNLVQTGVSLVLFLVMLCCWFVYMDTSQKAYGIELENQSTRYCGDSFTKLTYTTYTLTNDKAKNKLTLDSLQKSIHKIKLDNKTGNAVFIKLGNCSYQEFILCLNIILKEGIKSYAYRYNMLEVFSGNKIIHDWNILEPPAIIHVN
jgi:hypothetical protein